jgi:hypothetical protein
MAGLWWMVFGWSLGHVVDAYMEFGPPDGPFGGGGGGGYTSGITCVQHTSGYVTCTR